MAANKRSKVQRLNDLERIADLYLKGEPQWKIAEKLNITQQQVCYDLQKLYAEWKESALANINEKRARELAKIDKLEREYWLAFQRSRRVAKKEREKDSHLGLERTTEKRWQVGDPRFLDGVRQCIEMRCKILGINAPDQVNLQGDLNVVNSGMDPKESLLNRIKRLREKAVASDGGMDLATQEDRVPVERN